MRSRTWLPALLATAMASICVCALPSTEALADEVAPAPAQSDVDKAQGLFKKGAALYERKRYALALEQFRASYAAVASPNSRLYIARCLADMGELTDAYLEFEQVIEEAAARANAEPRYAKTRQTAIAERDELARKVAVVTVNVAHDESATSLEIAGRELPRARWGKPFPVPPGNAEIVLKSRLGSPSARTVTLAAGDTKEISLDAASGAPPTSAPRERPSLIEPARDDVAPPSSREHLRPYAYAAAGIGVAGFVVFTVAGLMSNSTYNELSDTCGGHCPPERQADVDAGMTQKTVANIGVSVGAVGLAAGATLFILSLTGRSSTADAGAAPSAAVVIGPCSVGLRGRL